MWGRFGLRLVPTARRSCWAGWGYALADANRVLGIVGVYLEVEAAAPVDDVATTTWALKVPVWGS